MAFDLAVLALLLPLLLKAYDFLVTICRNTLCKRAAEGDDGKRQRCSPAAVLIAAWAFLLSIPAAAAAFMGLELGDVDEEVNDFTIGTGEQAGDMTERVVEDETVAETFEDGFERAASWGAEHGGECTPRAYPRAPPPPL